MNGHNLFSLNPTNIYFFTIQLCVCCVSEDLIFAVGEISQGQASDATVNLLRDLQRPFPPDAPCPMKLFAHVAEAELHNSNCLLEMAGVCNFKSPHLEIRADMHTSFLCGTWNVALKSINLVGDRIGLTYPEGLKYLRIHSLQGTIRGNVIDIYTRHLMRLWIWEYMNCSVYPSTINIFRVQ